MRRLPLFLLASLAVVTTSVRAQEAKPRPRFVYTGDADFAPFDYLDASGQPTGFNVDLVRALARDAGVEVEIRLGDWNQARADVDAGKADLISLAYSEERARTYLWLARTWTMHQCLLFRIRPRPYPAGLDDLSGESIAVQERSAVAEMLLAQKTAPPRITTVSTQVEALRLLDDGAVTGVGGVSLTLRVAAARLGQGDFVELPLRAAPYGLVGARGRGAELGWVASSMAHLREAGTLEALAEKYLVDPAPPRTWWDYRYWFLSILAALLLAGMLSLAWNRSLLERVKARTREMEAAMERGQELMRSLSRNEQRFQTFMALTSEGIARLELDEPLAIDREEAEQVAHILRNARVAECNEAFSKMLHEACPANLVGLLIGDLSVAPQEVEESARAIVRSGYRLINLEVRRSRRGGAPRWISASVVGVVEQGRLKSIWLTQQDIEARKEAEESLRVRGRILEAVAFSSARLLESGSWEDHIDDVLARLGHAVGVGCAYIVENRQQPDGVIRTRVTHEWTVPGVPALTRAPAFQDLVWPDGSPLRDALSGRRTVATLVRDLTPTGRLLFEPIGLKSLLAVPIFVRDEWWGVLGFGDFLNERAWLDAEIEALKAAGASLGAALVREQAEEAAQATAAKHRDIVAFAPAGIYQATREGTVVMANLEFARLLGYERSEDVIGLSMGASVYFEAAERERLIAEYAAIGHAQRVEVRLKRRDGSVFWAEMSAHAVNRDESDEPQFFEGFVQDITARKAADEERERFGRVLERAADEWHRTFDAVDVAVLVLDRFGRLTRINRPALDLLGPEYSEVLGHTIEELEAREPWASAAHMVESVVQTRERASARAVDRLAGKTWELTAYLAQAGQGGEERIILVVRDISRLIELQESLRHSETMSAMGSLVAGVAHEVRNPLFSISATVDALESELGERQEYAELTGLLRSQVSRLRQLMRDLLDYGKPPVLRLAPVHPREVLRRAARACAGLAREREVQVVEEVPEAAPQISVDGSRLEQVFQNLFANAIQHSPRGARVRATLRIRPEDPAPEFVVEDEGSGIPEDEIPHLFEPFFSRRKGGTGLGLSVVQRIVEAHGGRVTAANRATPGAVFTVRLPASVIEKAEEAHG